MVKLKKNLYIKIKTIIFYSNVYFFKLKIFIFYKIKIKKLLLCKFEKIKFLSFFFSYIVLGLVKKKLNSVFFFKKTYIVGLSKMMKGAKMQRNKLIKHLKYRDTQINIFKIHALRRNNKKITNYNVVKIFKKDNDFLTDGKIINRKLKIYKCFLILLKLKYKRKINHIHILNAKHRFEKYDIRSIKLENINSFFIKKKKIILYIFFFFIKFKTFNFDLYLIVLYLLNIKNKKLQKNSSVLYLNKFFSKTLQYNQELEKNYFAFKYKTQYYYYKLIKYEIINKKHSIAFINRKTPNNLKKINVEILNLKRLNYIIFFYFLKLWLKSKNISILDKITKNYSKQISRFFKYTSFVNTKFFNKNIRYGNSFIFIYFSKFTHLFYKLKRKTEKYFKMFWKSAWRLNGIYQTEIFHFYLKIYLRKELNFLNKTFLVYLHNVYLHQFYENKTFIIMKLKKKNFYYYKNDFFNWLLKIKKKQKLSYNLIYNKVFQNSYKTNFDFFQINFISYFMFISKIIIKNMKVYLKLKYEYMMPYNIKNRYKFYVFYKKKFFLKKTFQTFIFRKY